MYLHVVGIPIASGNAEYVVPFDVIMNWVN